ncbi:N-6 DNA methylase [Rickettsia bellii]|nr:N-6 DNA methylase [Rickettsia bellii]KJV90451.1 N-6 DNA Methylase family protein [Rickettsia bellii str. RML An4]
MEWIVKALKPNGKAFVVVPDGIFNRQNDKNLRQLILDNCFIDAIISLPLKTFFTTPKKTYILAITKKHNISQIQTDPVFTYLCSEIGESRDIYRFDIEQDDLKEAVNLFNAFKGSKKYFANINHDKRCKLQGIDKFKADINWCVENFFTEEEKIDLGFIEKTGFLYIKEFNELLNDTLFIISSNANIINESQNLEQIKYDTKQASIFFDLLPVSKKIQKKDLKDKYTVPTYSSQTTEYGFVGYAKDIMFNASSQTPLVTFGDHTRKFFIRNESFACLDNVKVLKLKQEYIGKIDIEYISFVWENLIPNLGYSRHWKVAKNIEIKIPITQTGEFDLQKQKEIAEKYRKIEEIKKNIKTELEKIENIKVDIGL